MAEHDDLATQLKHRLTMLQAATGMNEARELKRRAAILEAVSALHDAADSVLRGHLPTQTFAARLVGAAEKLQEQA